MISIVVLIVTSHLLWVTRGFRPVQCSRLSPQNRPLPSVVGSLPNRRASQRLASSSSDNSGSVRPNADDANFWDGLLSLATLAEMQNILSLIVEENIEAVNYATTSLQQGEEVARRHRRSLLDPEGFSPDSVREDIETCFNRLDLLITNMALDKVRYRYSYEKQNEQREYLDQFVKKIDSSQTLARLLSQSPNQRTSEAAAARYKRNSAEHHSPGSPRHLVERLMFEGMKANIENSGGAARKLVVKDSEGNAYMTQPNVDILAIAQDVIDERASLCVVFGTKISDLMVLDVSSVKEKAHFLAQVREADNFLVIDMAGIPMKASQSIQLRFSKPAFLSPSVSINVGLKDSTDSTVVSGEGNNTSSLSIRAVSNRLNDDGSINTDDNTVRGESGAGLAATLSDTNRSSDSTEVSTPALGADGGNMGKASKALGHVFSSLFGGLKGDRKAGADSNANAERLKGQREGDTSPTIANDHVAVQDSLDKISPLLDQSDGNSDDMGRDHADRQPVGDLSAFLQLGIGARVRLIGQKEETGRKFLLLEGKSAPMEGPRGLKVRVVRQWIDHDEAVIFLTRNGYSDPATPSGGNVLTAGTEAGTGAGTQPELQNDDNSPFFGGNISMM